jgi:hypothetical protein
MCTSFSNELTQADEEFYKEWIESIGAIVEERRQKKNERNKRSYHNTQAALRAAQTAQQSAQHAAAREPEGIEREAQLVRESGPWDGDDPLGPLLSAIGPDGDTIQDSEEDEDGQPSSKRRF